jgi:hypothetical protein
MILDGRLGVVYLRPLDLSVDEAPYELRAAGASRVAIDMPSPQTLVSSWDHVRRTPSLFSAITAWISTGIARRIARTVPARDPISRARVDLPGTLWQHRRANRPDPVPPDVRRRGT